MSDGTTVYYDLFQPVRGKTCDHVILLVPGAVRVLCAWCDLIHCHASPRYWQLC